MVNKFNNIILLNKMKPNFDYFIKKNYVIIFGDMKFSTQTRLTLHDSNLLHKRIKNN